MKTNFQSNNQDFGDYFVNRKFFANTTMWVAGANNLMMPGTAKSVSPIISVSNAEWKMFGFLNDGGAYGLKTDGSMWAWGYNAYGLMGLNDRTYRSSPVQIASGSSWKWMAGTQSSYTRSLHAIRSDGTLWSWGRNLHGQLGDNSITSKSSPVQVAGGGTDWKRVDPGYYHVLATKQDGTLWVWGDNSYGRLGLGLAGSAKFSSPMQITSGGGTWKYGFGVYRDSMGIKTDGTVWTWGSGAAWCGGLSGNTPIRLGSDSDWKEISCTEYTNALLLKANSTIWTVSGTNTITQVTNSGTGWKYVNSASGAYYAIKTDESLWAWGNNDGFSDATAFGKLFTNVGSAQTLTEPTNVFPGRKFKMASAGWGGTGMAVEIGPFTNT